ncbi:hypothetical protein M2397_005895 [Pseudomonas sp. BIGb0381]|uniref:hypothetical protein n=1 Tax=unclassified Pseudomonas TaxID=196821 RepID=UPI001115A889|nr:MULTISPECIES: hypothetical protein [unclassified Pseudomonas]MCS4315561.1 hypothetical protein [Pseudomonas sp. BIGb0381]
MKNTLAVLVVALAGLLNAGCEAESGSALSGRWVEKTQDQSKHPRVLTIAREEGTFRVDEEIYLNGQYKTQREVGQPVSKSVISVKNGMRNIRFENGVIFYRNLEFVKAG